MRNPFFYALVFANLYSMLHLGLYVVGANAYDIKGFKRVSKSSGTKRGRPAKLPLVSVVIPAHNEGVVIKRTLDSVLSSTYYNLEIVVVDDGSTDKTAEVVQRYIAKLPRVGTKSYIPSRGRRAAINRRFKQGPILWKPVRLVQQRNAGKAAALNRAINRYAHGQLVMCLDADSVLHPEAIERAVSYFSDKRIIGVAANVRVMPNRHWLGILQRFEHMIGYRAKKFFSLTNSEFIIGGVASTYRMSALEKVNLYDTDTMTEDIGLSLKLLSHYGNRKHRIIYAADVVAMTEGVQTFRALMRQRYRWKMGCWQNLFKYQTLIGNSDHKKYSRSLTHYRLPTAIFSELLLLAEPMLYGYIIYICITYHSIGIILGAYLTVTAYVLWVIWPDEHLSLVQKLKLSSMSWMMYLLFYAMDVVQLSAMVRCLISYKSIYTRANDLTWTSPKRAGQTASF